MEPVLAQAAQMRERIEGEIEAAAEAGHPDAQANAEKFHTVE